MIAPRFGRDARNQRLEAGSTLCRPARAETSCPLPLEYPGKIGFVFPRQTPQNLPKALILRWICRRRWGPLGKVHKGKAGDSPVGGRGPMGTCEISFLVGLGWIRLDSLSSSCAGPPASAGLRRGKPEDGANCGVFADRAGSETCLRPKAMTRPAGAPAILRFWVWFIISKV